MATILDTLKRGTEYLEKYGIADARLNMELLIAHVVRLERMQLYLDFDRPLDEESLEALRALVKRRSRGEPLQHLLGSIEFCELEFKTDARALIPRPETEELATFLRTSNSPPPSRVLDMGCGSGVLGLSIIEAFEESSLVLADISPKALELASENAAGLGLDRRVELAESDLFSAVSGQFCLIAANLPYVPLSEQAELSREVKWDPALALYGGEVGTEIIEKFLGEAPAFLSPGGKLALEFGIKQEKHLFNVACDTGFHEVEIVKDLSGTDRFLLATKPF